MPIPQGLEDVEVYLPYLFKKPEDGYDFYSPKKEATGVIRLTKDELDEIINEPIETRWIHADILEDPSEVKTKQYNLTHNDAMSILSGKVYVGIDGGSTKIKREQLFFLFARSIRYYYSLKGTPVTINGKQKRYDEFISRAFYLVDENLKREGAPIESRTFDFESVRNGRLIVYAPSTEDPKDIDNQAMGYEVRLRHLTELAILDKLVDDIEESNLNPEEVVIILDGPLIPRSLRAAEYQDTIKKVIKKGFLVISFIKRMSYSRILRTIMLKEKISHIFSKALFGTEDTRFVQRYLSDGMLVHKALPKNGRTFMFRYKLVGKMGRRREDYVEDDYQPVAFYLKTSLDKIYRVEFPYYYYKQDSEIGEKIVRIIFSLLHDNHSYLPRPIELADSLAGISENERQYYSKWLDSVFWNKLGIRLYPPYGEEW